MEIIKIAKTDKDRGTITLKFAGTLRSYDFAVFNPEGGIFGVNFHEDLNRLLRVLPIPITQTLVRAIRDSLESKPTNLPTDLKLESRLLEMV